MLPQVSAIGNIHSGTIEREVVRRDADADADRVPHRFGIDVAGDVRQDLAHDQARDAAGEFDDFDAAVHFGPGLGERLAVLAGDERGELFEVFFQQLAEAEHHAGPLDDRRLGPGRERGGGGFDDFAGLLRRRRTARGRSPGRWTG